MTVTLYRRGTRMAIGALAIMDGDDGWDLFVWWGDEDGPRHLGTFPTHSQAEGHARVFATNYR